MQDNDILIRRKKATSARGDETREFYTLHRYPNGEKFAGPWTEQHARDEALRLGGADGVDVWLEDGPETNNYSVISD